MPEDPVRLQLLLHHRDKQLDEMAERFKARRRMTAERMVLVLRSNGHH